MLYEAKFVDGGMRVDREPEVSASIPKKTGSAAGMDMEPIACYVWTDTQIINAVNAKAAFYPEREAVLFVLMYERVSTVLLDAVEQTRTFQRIVRIQPPPEYQELPVWQRRLRLLFCGRGLQHYFDGYVGNARYSRLLVSGYWAHTLFMLKAMYRNNPDIRVALLEEGIGTYYRTRARTCQMTPRTGMAERLGRAVYFGRFAGKAADMLDQAFVYRPEFICMEGLTTFQLPALSGNKELFGPLLQCWNALDTYGTYARAQTYLFSFPGNGDVQKAETQICDIIESQYPDFLQALHPMREGTTGIPFEAICACDDISDRLLIGCCSSCMHSPKNSFDQEPYVIFTYLLYPKSAGLRMDEAAFYAENLKRSYRDPSRIMVPQSLAELNDALEHVKTRRRKMV